MPARHRDPHPEVAGLADQPGQALALGADHERPAGRRDLQVADVHVAVGGQADHEQPGLLVRLQRTGQVGRPGHRQPGGRTGRRSSRRPPSCRPRAARARRRRARRRRRPSGRPRPGCAGRSPRPARRSAASSPRSAATAQQVVGVRVLVRRDLQRQALVDERRRSSGPARARRLQQRDAAVGREPAAPRATRSSVSMTGSDVQRGRRHAAPAAPRRRSCGRRPARRPLARRPRPAPAAAAGPAHAGPRLGVPLALRARALAARCFGLRPCAPRPAGSGPCPAVALRLLAAACRRSRPSSTRRCGGSARAVAGHGCSSVVHQPAVRSSAAASAVGRPADSSGAHPAVSSIQRRRPR